MGKIAITKKKLLKEYKHEVDEISEYLENKTQFSGEEICQIIHGILIENKVKTNLTTKKLYTLYHNKVESLNITRDEWVEKYGIPEIIDLIYNILEENN